LRVYRPFQATAKSILLDRNFHEAYKTWYLDNDNEYYIRDELECFGELRAVKENDTNASLRTGLEKET